MKQDIHPQYGSASIRCACGNVMETQSTVQGVIQVEICSACHPFFTGRQKLVDTAGRIDRFQKKFGSRVALGTAKKAKKSTAPKTASQPKMSLRDLNKKNKSGSESPKK